MIQLTKALFSGIISNMDGKKKRLLSGVKPTGELHIGNYFGAVKQFVNTLMDGEHECTFMLADYHALNFIQDAEEMRKLTNRLVASYVAVGLDPTKAVIFKQSDVSAHTELAWIFNTITTMPYLQRAHAYKDAEAKQKEISVGAFDYPMLMAADILLYDTDIVPVGQDQKQHVEYTRDTAEKFNRIFGETFTLPKELILPNTATVPGIDGQKMSKSYNNTIPLFASREEIIKKVMAIVTDSSGGRPENVYAIHNLFKTEEELTPLYESEEGNYKVIKETLIEDIDAYLSPMRARYEELMLDTTALRDILDAGAKKAREVADAKMAVIKKNIGVTV